MTLPTIWTSKSIQPPIRQKEIHRWLQPSLPRHKQRRARNQKPRGSAQTGNMRSAVKPMPAGTNPFASVEPPPEQPGKPGLLSKLNPFNWFSSASQEPTVVTPSQPPGNERVNATPPPTVNTTATPKPPPAKPVRIIQPAPPCSRDICISRRVNQNQATGRRL